MIIELLYLIVGICLIIELGCMFELWYRIRIHIQYNRSMAEYKRRATDKNNPLHKYNCKQAG